MKRDTNATNDATRDTTKGDLSRDVTRHGVAISEAAQLLGVSIRTVQRRLDKGELRSIERDGKRFVLLDPDATERDTVSRQLSQSDATQEQHSATNDATEATPKPLDWEKREADFREEIKFLRGLVEQRDRDAAEIRAALRKALEAEPRQLMSGAPQETTQAPPMSANVLPVSPMKEPQRVPEREPRPLWKLILGVR